MVIRGANITKYIFGSGGLCQINKAIQMKQKKEGSDVGGNSSFDSPVDFKCLPNFSIYLHAQ
jgi:hypothetical protein